MPLTPPEETSATGRSRKVRRLAEPAAAAHPSGGRQTGAASNRAAAEFQHHIFAQAGKQLPPVPASGASNTLAGSKTNDDNAAADEGVTLLCTVSDGKIGSIYSATQRIRMPHATGAGYSNRDSTNLFRFNIVTQTADAAFKQAEPDAEQFAQTEDNPSKTYYQMRKFWIADTLMAAREQNKPLPDWAAIADRPGEVSTFMENDEADTQKFLEIYFRSADGGRIVHQSRGGAQSIHLPKATLETITEAAALVEPLSDPEQKNQVFYDHLKKNAPTFSRLIAPPEEQET